MTQIVASHPTPLIPTTSPDWDTIEGQAANLPFQYEILTGTTDVIQGGGGGLGAIPGGAVAPIVGTSLIEAGAVDNCTMAAPVAGDPAVGGNDGLEITIMCVTAFAHTVTTPANAIAGGKHLITFAAAIGSFITLVARNGKWYPMAQSGATIT